MADQGEAKTCTGIVKLVLSGDSVVIRGLPKGGPPPEKTLRFSGVTAPRLARRPGANSEGEAEADEPFAWESREYLRRKLVGQAVNFVIDYSVPSGQEFGTVFLPAAPGAAPENITHALIAAGMVKVREGRREEGPEAMAIQAIQSQVADQGIGLWSPKAATAIRTVKWTCEDARRLVDEHGGKPVNAVIEHVRDGCTMRAFLLPSMQNISIMLTGIKTPGFKRQEGGPDKVEPYAHEAKYFVESRLLQRNVKVVLEGVAGQSVLASVLHPKGNISEFLINEGFARIVDWSIGQVGNPAVRDAMRASQEESKASGKRIWQHYTSPTAGMTAADISFKAKVIEIKNCERLIVVKHGATEPTELSLASLRQPRKPKTDKPAERVAQSGGEGEDAAAVRRPVALFEVPFMLDGREFLRQKLLGKTVDVTVDYVKPAEEQYPAKTCVTIVCEGTNVSEALISKGFATVLRHRQDDDNRSACYGELAAAEERAQKGNKGVHSLKPGVEGPITRVADIRSKPAADNIVGAVQRRGKVGAIVEAVVSGARLRLYIPKETCRCTVMLAGISAPRTAFRDSAAEPYADEAKQFMLDNSLQHDVEVELFDSDRNGNLLGSVSLRSGLSLGTALIEEGLGKMHFSASRYGNDAELSAAEAKAKAGKKNLWAKWDPSQDVVHERRASSEEGPKDRTKAYKPVIITHVKDATTFYAQYAAEAEELTALSALLNEKLSAGDNEPCSPKRHATCAAKFSADGTWYRAKVLRVVEDKFEIFFSDYGNEETVTAAALAEVPEEVEALGLKPQANLMKLALLNMPPDDWAAEAAGVLADGIMYKTFQCNVEYTDRDDDGAEAQYVSIVDDQTETDDVAKTMLSMGYATAFRRRDRHLQDLFTEYVALQKEASESRQGMWMYGDISDDPRDI